MVDNEDPDQREYEIENLLDKQEVRKYGRGKGTAVEYLVKWKDWGPAHNAWHQVEDLQDAKELMDSREATNRNSHNSGTTPAAGPAYLIDGQTPSKLPSWPWRHLKGLLSLHLERLSA